MTMNISNISLAKYDAETYAELTASNYVWKIFSPILIFFGTIGNILCIVVLRRPKIRKSACSIYFIALALSDLFVLYIGLLRQWIDKTFDVDVRHFGIASCKIHTWLVYFFLDFSSWILVAVTVNRLILVWFPRKAKASCTRRFAKLSLVIIGICLLLINSHIMYGYGMHAKQTNATSVIEYTCSFISDNYKTFWISVWPLVDLAVFCGIPFLCLLGGNLLIFLKVLYSRKAVKYHLAVKNNQSTKKRHSSFSSMSVMLLVINTMFLICNTPISVYMIGYDIWVQNLHGRDFVIIDSLLWSIVNILMYLNNSINFVIYILSGSRFRNEAKSMFSKSRYLSDAITPKDPKTNNFNSIHTCTLNNRIVGSVHIDHTYQVSKC